jgi:hypothetical protein
MRPIFTLAALSVLLGASPALADQFVPFEVDQVMYRDLMNYLGDVPAKYANPLIAAFERKQKEAEAKALKSKDDSKREPSSESR